MNIKKSDYDQNLMLGVYLSIKSNSLTRRNSSLFTGFDSYCPLIIMMYSHCHTFESSSSPLCNILCSIWFSMRQLRGKGLNFCPLKICKKANYVPPIHFRVYYELKSSIEQLFIHKKVNSGLCLEDSMTKIARLLKRLPDLYVDGIKTPDVFLKSLLYFS